MNGPIGQGNRSYMNVEQRDIDDLNAELKIRIEPEDVQEEFEKQVEDQRKRANIPGFRPGKVPQSLIKKKYGKELLGRLIEQKLQEALQNHVQGLERRTIGGPMPKEDQELQDIDPEELKPFEFTYELGFAPEIDTDLSQESFPYYKVRVDEEMVDQQVEDLKKRYGQLVEVEEVGEEDMVTGDFKELDENGNEKEDGIQHRSSVVMTALEDEEAKKGLIGLKKGDVVKVDPKKLSKGEQDLASMLNIEKEQARELDSHFNFEVQDIRRMQPAELDQDLFDKVFGEGEITDEESCRQRLREQLEGKFEPESDKLLQKHVLEHLMEKQELPLPDQHLKRWIKNNNKEAITDEQLEADYENYARNVRWQLVESQLIRENELKVEEQDAVNYTKSLIMQQYEQYGIPNPGDEELEQSARKILSDQNEGERIFDNLYGYKLIEHFKENLNLEEKEVSYDEFLKLAQAEQEGESEEVQESEQEQSAT